MADAVIAVSQGTREDVLRLFNVAGGADRSHPQRDRPRRIPPAGPRPTRWSSTGSTPRCRTCCSSAASRARRGSSTWSTRDPASRAGVAVVLCAGAPDTPEIAAEMERAVRRGAGASTRTSSGSREMVDKPDGPPAVFARGGVLLPVGLRAVRDHQPRGHGVRDRRSSRARWAASRKSSSMARRGCWCRSKPRAAGPFEPRDPDAFERDLAAADQRADGR